MSNELLRVPGRLFRENFAKSYSEKDLDRLKSEHIDTLIEIDYLEQKLKAFQDQIKEQLKPLKEKAKELLPVVKTGQQIVNQDVYYDIDDELAVINFIDPQTSEVIGKRKMTREERSPIFTNENQF